jgi:hypothetical protein
VENSNLHGLTFKGDSVSKGGFACVSRDGLKTVVNEAQYGGIRTVFRL